LGWQLADNSGDYPLLSLALANAQAFALRYGLPPESKAAFSMLPGYQGHAEKRRIFQPVLSYSDKIMTASAILCLAKNCRCISPFV
jgi:hypothetical protein